MTLPSAHGLPHNCKRGLVCNTDGPKTCQPPVSEGGACTSGWDCDAGLRCVFDVCAPPVGDGGNTRLCETSFDCGVDAICWQGACEPKHAIDEPCETSFDCVFGLFCSDAGVCYDAFERAVCQRRVRVSWE